MIDAEKCVTFLNELLEHDPEGVNALFGMHVPVNKAIADHPTVQVALGDDKVTRLGVLGLLNGLFSSSSPGMIQAVLNDEQTRVLWFRVRKSGTGL